MLVSGGLRGGLEIPSAPGAVQIWSDRAGSEASSGTPSVGTVERTRLAFGHGWQSPLPSSSEQLAEELMVTAPIEQYPVTSDTGS